MEEVNKLYDTRLLERKFIHNHESAIIEMIVITVVMLVYLCAGNDFEAVSDEGGFHQIPQ
jgi:hypothetical protein